MVSFFVALVGALIIFATLRTVMNEKSGNMRLSVVWGRAVWWLPALCLLSPCFCPWRGYLAPSCLLGHWLYRCPFDSRKDGVVMDLCPCLFLWNERQSFGIWSKRRGMKPCGPWSNPFSSFGFSAWNFSNRIRKRLDSRSSGISFKPVRQLEPKILNSASNVLLLVYCKNLGS